MIEHSKHLGFIFGIVKNWVQLFITELFDLVVKKECKSRSDEKKNIAFKQRWQ